MLGVLGGLGAQGAKVHKRAWWIKVLGNLGVGSLGPWGLTLGGKGTMGFEG